MNVFWILVLTAPINESPHSQELLINFSIMTACLPLPHMADSNRLITDFCWAKPVGLHFEHDFDIVFHFHKKNWYSLKHLSTSHISYSQAKAKDKRLSFPTFCFLGHCVEQNRWKPQDPHYFKSHILGTGSTLYINNNDDNKTIIIHLFSLWNQRVQYVSMCTCVSERRVTSKQTGPPGADSLRAVIVSEAPPARSHSRCRRWQSGVGAHWQASAQSTVSASCAAQHHAGTNQHWLPCRVFTGLLVL